METFIEIPEFMSTQEIVAELLAEHQGSLSEQEYAMLYASEQTADNQEFDYVEGV